MYRTDHYVSGVGINFSVLSRTLDFSNIDYDVWMSQLFTAVDTVLTPFHLGDPARR